ncbi:MAG: undecaprenyl-diphosphatase UppP [Chloroflexota bacterium]|nr:MAG: undecaprenyl-diphosphatase UppP [Chloroflexota bacterium]
MDFLEAIVLGVVQGLTEFMPISSSAHLIVVPWLFGWNEPGLAFDVALHIGTLLAVLTYFWSDWISLLRSLVRSLSGRSVQPGESRLLWILVVGTVPGAIAGFLAEKKINETFHTDSTSIGGMPVGSILLIASAVVVLGALLFVADRIGRRTREFHGISMFDGLIIGLAQAAALLPGVSRSGATLTMGLLLGLSRPAAARFSFMLSLPIIAGAGLKESYDVVQVGLSGKEALLFATGVVTAAIAGYLCIAGLLRFLQSNTTTAFVLYRFALGAALVVLALSRGGL